MPDQVRHEEGRGGVGVKIWRGVILLGWTALIITVTGFGVFVFAFGDCMEARCGAHRDLAVTIVLAGGFVIYWMGVIGAAIYWNRK
jgi:hypothetical protein